MLKHREEALRCRHLKQHERLSEHTKRLPPLKVGDTVRIQNQIGPAPTKWDKTGTVIEVKQFDQYMVRVHGSGRATLRNRKFLRRYTPIQPSNEYAYNLDKLRFTTPQLTSTETPPARPSPTGTPTVMESADTTTMPDIPADYTTATQGETPNSPGQTETPGPASEPSSEPTPTPSVRRSTRSRMQHIPYQHISMYHHLPHVYVCNCTLIMYQYTIQCIIYLYIHEYPYALNAYPAHMYIIFPCRTTSTVIAL